MKKRFFLLIWLFAILFPFAWLGDFSRRFRFWFDRLFEPNWIHVLVHAVLFFVLAVLLVWVFKPARTWRTIGLLAGALLLAGLSQEVFQAVTRLNWDWAGILFDLGVDLTGGLAGLALLSLNHRWH